MSYCSNALAERFGALVMTLEMPFKDATATPDHFQGWSPERCARLAHSCLDTLHLVLGPGDTIMWARNAL